jgi:hypothetical protein
MSDGRSSGVTGVAESARTNHGVLCRGSAEGSPICEGVAFRVSDFHEICRTRHSVTPATPELLQLLQLLNPFLPLPLQITNKPHLNLANPCYGVSALNRGDL